MVTPRELAEFMGAIWALSMAGIILNFVVIGMIENAKDNRELQRKFVDYMQREVESALWKFNKKKGKIA